jgi:hypothetical protein
LIDQEGFQKFIYNEPLHEYHTHESSRLLSFSLTDSANQLKHILLLLKEFPLFEIRLAYPSPSQTFFTVNNAVLTYNNRLPKKNENDQIWRPKGDYYEAGNIAAEKRVKYFDESWSLASINPLYNRNGTIKFLENILEKVLEKVNVVKI